MRNGFRIKVAARKTVGDNIICHPNKYNVPGPCEVIKT
jgi:hypothetical protein